jgi:hypothetical protein
MEVPFEKLHGLSPPGAGLHVQRQTLDRKPHVGGWGTLTSHAAGE